MVQRLFFCSGDREGKSNFWEKIQVGFKSVLDLREVVVVEPGCYKPVWDLDQGLVSIQILKRCI